MSYLIYIIIFLFGLAIGSFINALIYRLYNQKPIVGRVRSECPHCGHILAWYDLIPILSFIMLIGRCRYCQKKISWQYPVVELTTGFLFVIIFFNTLNQFSPPAGGFNFSAFAEASADWQFSIILIRDWLIIFTLLFIFVYDLKYLLVEDIVVIPAAIFSLIVNIIIGGTIWKLLLAGGAAALFFLLQYLITKGKGIGLGDTRIGLFMGFALGWPNIIVAIFFAYSIGLIVGLFLLLTRRRKIGAQVPLGPFLAMGTFIALFWGDLIIKWYLDRLYL